MSSMSTPTSRDRLVRSPIHSMQLNRTPEERERERQQRYKSSIDVSRPRQYGGAIGIFLLLIFIGHSVYTLSGPLKKGQWNPTWAQATYVLRRTLQDFPKNALMLVDVRTIAYVGAVLLAEFVLYAVVPGRTVLGARLDNGDRLQYRMNGLTVLLLNTLAITAVYSMRRFDVVEYLNANWLTFVAALITWWKVAAAICALAAWYTPKVKKHVDADSGNIIYDMAMGPILNPRILGIDFKIVLWRTALIVVAVYNWAALMPVIDSAYRTSTLPDNYALVALGLLGVIYASDVLWFEDNMLHSFYVRRDGLGALSCFWALVWQPCCAIVPTMYVHQHGVQALPHWLCTVPPIIVYILGMYIRCRSDNEMCAFKVDWSPRIRTRGLWARCRHPNYFGEICMLAAQSMLIGGHAWLPHLYPVATALSLLARAHRIDNWLERRDGSTRVAYNARVPNSVWLSWKSAAEPRYNLRSKNE